MKLLLVSDETMNENAGGLSQTLYNIFCFIDPENILCITSDKAFKKNPPSARFESCYLTYHFNIFETPRNRFTKYIQKSFSWFNYTVNQHLRGFKKLKNALMRFGPDVVVVCPNGTEGLFMHQKLKESYKQKKVYPYFMDDWLYQSYTSWAGGDVQQLAKAILSENKSWLMISEYLSDIFSKRYHVVPERLLAVHNPVDLKNIPEPYCFKKINSYTIAYAGSLWPMHFDAFLNFAEAVRLLKKEKQIEIIIYTSKAQWDWRAKSLLSLGVLYGGHIPYKQIHNKLGEADCLLVTSSFSKEWVTHSEGSVQTKITDYLKAGRLIISYGPNYAANHKFLKKYNCGICIDSTDVRILSEKIDEIIEHAENYSEWIENGYSLLRKQFSLEHVHKKLLDFVN